MLSHIKYFLINTHEYFIFCMYAVKANHCGKLILKKIFIYIFKHFPDQKKNFSSVSSIRISTILLMDLNF